ncbi:glycosyltransferase family 4 protein [Actinomyces faecalis]|uniref:glycosyltransferase family 4 protein n=1 Tax=Actinomyces faecalis TaxID=2722820 RepID=UPI001C12EDE1|nr:glycosyltransferase family 4 protein [Actinomyces faecalis]
MTRSESSPDRMRVLEVCGSAAGGVRVHVAHCARVLASAGHDVIVEAPASVLAGARLGPARGEALEIGPRPGPGDLQVLARLRRLGRSADVVHAHGLRAGALAALALGRRRARRTRLVVTEHNLPVGGRLTRATGQALARLVASRADYVLGVSPDLVEQALSMGAAQAELAVVPAVTAPQPGGQATGLSAADVEEVWSSAGYRVLTVARLAPQKGLDLLLEAAGLLPGALTQASSSPVPSSDVTWAVAGDGPLADELAARIKRDRLPVRLLGRRTQVSELMRAADVVVQTSLWEGQPITVQEALAAGAAIIATDVGGTRVTARGGARLVPPQPEQIASAVAGLLADPARREAARASARQAAERLPGEAELAAQLAAVLGDGV